MYGSLFMKEPEDIKGQSVTDAMVEVCTTP